MQFFDSFFFLSVLETTYWRQTKGCGLKGDVKEARHSPVDERCISLFIIEIF